MEIERVGVLGCGLMGHGIAQICAQAGWEVVVREADQGRLDKGIGKIEKQLGRAVEKGKMEQSDADAARARITPTLDYSDLAECDLVIEAITEDLDRKLEMWGEVDGVVSGDGAVFATNTSSLPVVNQAVATSRPDRFLGLHFFNPAQVMPLLEVVQTVTTSEEAVRLGFEVGEKLGKTCVHAKDKTGFIVNRLLVPYMLDAIRAYEEGVGSIEEIDTAMKAGANHPMGPLTLLDFVGLDTTTAIADVMFDEYRERRFAAPPTLRKMVAAGLYGRKSGKGFYDYSGEEPAPVDLGL
jgi:3-hydroxybutyryl-CoA dehydrogenase